MYAAASVKPTNMNKVSTMEYKMDFMMELQIVFKMEFVMVFTMVFQMVTQIVFKMEFEMAFAIGPKMKFPTKAAIPARNTGSKGPPVIKIADTFQSHFSAAVGKVNAQDMKWMAPKRATTPIMVQNEGGNSTTSFSS